MPNSPIHGEIAFGLNEMEEVKQYKDSTDSVSYVKVLEK